MTNEPEIQFTPELKAKWLAALRSGEYEQARARLRSPRVEVKTMCCLGVLCDVIDPTKWHVINGEWTWGDEMPGHRNSKYLPANLRERFGFNALITDKYGAAIEAALANRNDGLEGVNAGRSLTFAEIADWIEAHVPALEQVTP